MFTFMYELKELLEIELNRLNPVKQDVENLMDKIVVVEGLISGDYILMLTQEFLEGSIQNAINKGLISIREGTLKEKEYWFNQYDTKDLDCVSVKQFKEWMKNSLYEVKSCK